MVMWICIVSECMQVLLKSAGKDGKTTVFLLTDTQIKEEAFLEDVDGLLNAGEVPNLFELDEKQEILEVCVCVCVCWQVNWFVDF